MTETATNHPLPKPKFTDRERAAWGWLRRRGIPVLVDSVTKKVSAPSGDYASIIEFARCHGWDG